MNENCKCRRKLNVTHLFIALLVVMGAYVELSSFNVYAEFLPSVETDVYMGDFPCTAALNEHIKDRVLSDINYEKTNKSLVANNMFTKNSKSTFTPNELEFKPLEPRIITKNLTVKTGISAREIDSLVAGTDLEGIGEAVHETESRYGVNALFILAVAIEESGWGSSYLANDRNNLFGICAYHDETVDQTATHFSSKAECVDYFGRLISKEYFAYNRTDINSIHERYAESPLWGAHINNVMNDLIRIL